MACPSTTIRFACLLLLLLPACLATYQDVDSVEDMSLGQFMIRLHEETPDDAIDAIVEALEAAIAEDREWEVAQLREDLEALDITQIVLNFFFTTLSIVVPQHNTTTLTRSVGGQRGHLTASAYQRGRCCNVYVLPGHVFVLLFAVGLHGDQHQRAAQGSGCIACPRPQVRWCCCFLSSPSMVVELTPLPLSSSRSGHMVRVFVYEAYALVMASSVLGCGIGIIVGWTFSQQVLACLLACFAAHTHPRLQASQRLSHIASLFMRHLQRNLFTQLPLTFFVPFDIIVAVTLGSVVAALLASAVPGCALTRQRITKLLRST